MPILWAILLYLFSLSSVIKGAEENSTYSIDDFKCVLPDITTVDSKLNITRFRTEFSKISEVKFPSLIGPLNEKLICKIKCIDGNWVGPLCSTTEDGRFQPILRECPYKNAHPLLLITYKNSAIREATLFPHGSQITVRCSQFGVYKLKGDSVIRCENGDWVPTFPSCVPTTILTNYTSDAPPTIAYTVSSGSASVEGSGALHVFPDSSLRLDCLSQRALGDPEWTWTQAHTHPITAGWSLEVSERDTHYRLQLPRVSARHSDSYTCTTPTGHTNTVAITVVNVTCREENTSSARVIAQSEGQRLGHSVRYSCKPGFHLDGAQIAVCMSDGRWSAPPPTCVETFCRALRTLGPHLSVLEYNSSVGGRALFQCSWGYRLVGNPGVECEQDGNWSGDIPTCVAIYCPKPSLPENGKMLSESPPKDDKYSVGDLVSYVCNEGFAGEGEASIVCTENGVWSHPPPFCRTPSEIRKPDTIYLENITLVHVDE